MKEWKKHYYSIKGTIAAIIGWAAVAMGALFTVVGLTSGFDLEDGRSAAGSVIFVTVLLYIIGFLCIRHSDKNKTLIRSYQKFSPLLANSFDGSLDYIAAAAGISYDAAREDIQKLIEAGLFPGYYIDVENRAVVMPISYMQEPVLYPTDAANGGEFAEKTVKCPHCGGMNTVAGSSSIFCEYCGSPLE